MPYTQTGGELDWSHFA